MSMDRESQVIMSRVENLRNLMRAHGIDFYYVPSSDAHQNEYVPEHWQRRGFISGFTGSAGDVLVGLDQAYLWTDGRYFLQAEKELDPQVYLLMKRVQGSGNSFFEFLRQQKKIKLGVDPKVISATEADKLKEILKESDGELISIEENFIDQLMVKINKEINKEIKLVRLADLKTAGDSAQDKIKNIQEAMRQEQANYLLVSTLDSIAWLLNIRGEDVAYNPLVISYLILDLDQNQTFWFLDINKLNQNLLAYCKDQNIQIVPYENFGRALEKLKGTVWLDPNTASFWMKNRLENLNQINSNQIKFLEKKLPIDLAKACKKNSEVLGMQEAHIKDAVSIINFLYFLEHEKNWQYLDEYQIGEKLLEFRQQDKTFEGPSFETIAGYGSNSAVIHYRASLDSAKKLSDDNLFLLDSGGQYPEGTTDITRVFHFGVPSSDQKKHYTWVLKGHLALARACFVQGSAGMHLDALARQFLWAEGLDFLHGTGHGVGCNLCVHEGPQRISSAVNTQALLPGMVVSNEPGVYFPGKYGIRIENLCFVKEVFPKDAYGIGVGPFLGFEDLTLVPYSQNLINFDLLTQQERDQIKNYHRRILERVGPRLSSKVSVWLETKINEKGSD